MNARLLNMIASARHSYRRVNSCRSGLGREQALHLHRQAFAGKPAPTVLLIGMLWLSPTHAADSLDLDGSTITGNQELPKALYIVPWKSADPGNLAGRPLNSLVDEILAPVDRDVFLRELEYYETVHSSE